MAAQLSELLNKPGLMDAALHWRMVGPYRGGRVMAVAGHPHDPMTFYFGSTGGGVWRTSNGGATWDNITDQYFRRASVGALAVAPSDPNVLYVGMGECGMRTDQTHGDGVYKSTDGGRSWQHLGLAATHNIGKIEVDPHDANRLYVAAFGHRFGPNPERGVYRSLDGGATWQQVLFVSPDAGAIDLALDAANPRNLYAAIWDMRMQPWGRTNRGPQSALYKSSDGGDTWTKISDNPGFPTGPLGRIGLCAAPTCSGRVWALVDAGENAGENGSTGGIYRSDDGGATWTWLSADRNFLVRPWYFMHLTADPVDVDTLYVVNRKLWKSVDGGRSYRQVNVPYVDNHALWVDAKNPRRMIIGNDGGAAVSFNGGDTWSTLLNQPTAEIYRIAADTHFPYRVYGSQQDNSTLCLPSRSERGPISHMEWYDVGGGESGYIAVRPDDPEIVYSSDLPGLGVTRYDHRTHQLREISPWIEPDGMQGDEVVHRYNWSTPIVISPHDPNRLYILGNRVFRSHDEGEHWEPISPDLTRSDPEKLGGASGTGENSIVNDYCTISSFSESPSRHGVLWAGTDDGLVHCSQDDGLTWRNVTPPDLPAWSTVHVEASPHAAGTVYAAATAHALDDFHPYVYRSEDFGQTWQPIVNGLPADDFIRVVRGDPVQPSLLYAGGESGVYLSLDAGANWWSLQLNLPHAPVHDLIVAGNDLVIGTHGRGLWILDDITPLRELAARSVQLPVHLFAPAPVYRLTRHAYGLNSLNAAYEPFAAPNPPSGVVVTFWLEHAAKTARMELLDADGALLQHLGPRAAPPQAAPIGPLAYHLQYGVSVLKAKPAGQDEWGVKWGAITLPPERDNFLPLSPGLHRCELPLFHPGPLSFPGISAWVAPLLVPGEYLVRLEVDGEVRMAPVTVHKDPRVPTTQAEFAAQLSLMLGIRDKISEVHLGVWQIRSLRRQLEERLAALPVTRYNQLRAVAARLLPQLAAVEAELIQVHKGEHSGELDGIHFPPKLNAKLASLAYSVSRSDNAPTEMEYAVYADLAGRADRQLARLHDDISEAVTEFNVMAQALAAPAIWTDF